MHSRASSSKSPWSVSPETIMSHHFRLAKGVPAVVNVQPPYSMYNSPMSIHYTPKHRPSSADPNKRRPLSRPQRELNDFVNGRKHGKPLPLTKRSSLTDLTKPKLLENPNYQPPRRRPQTSTKKPVTNDVKNSVRFQKINEFKDIVLTEVISQDDYTDKFILDTIRRNMEQMAGIVPWNDLEKAATDLMANLDISDTKKLHNKTKIETPKMDLSSISGSSKSASSSSSSSSSSSFSASSSSSGSV